MILKIHAGYFMVKGKNAFSNAFLQMGAAYILSHL